jgi:hypothetical protein
MIVAARVHGVWGFGRRGTCGRAGEGEILV